MPILQVPTISGSLITSLRNLGYSSPSAIADIVDNSLSAGATFVRIFAELLFLKDVMIPRYGVRASIDAWKGPRFADQDFIVGDEGFEIKTSINPEAEEIGTSSTRQFDESLFSTLHLVCTKLTLSGGGGVSLLDLLQQIEGECVTQGAADLCPTFDALISPVGWTRVLRDDHLDSEKLDFEGRLYFRVGGGPSRVREVDRTVGINDSRYGIQTARCMPFSAFERDVFPSKDH